MVVLHDQMIDLDFLAELRKSAIENVYGSFPQPYQHQLSPRWSSLNHFLSFRGAHQGHPRSRICGLQAALSVACVRHCSDTRDRIFGLVGICPELRDFEVDYTLTPMKLLGRAFEAIRNARLDNTKKYYGYGRIEILRFDDLATALNARVDDFVKIASLIEVHTVSDEINGLSNPDSYIIVHFGNRYFVEAGFSYEAHQRFLGKVRRTEL